LRAPGAPARDGPGLVAARGFDVQSALAQFRATCDIYLGAGERAISLLTSCQKDAGSDSRRKAITGALLARAHAQAGDPDRACSLATEALGADRDPRPKPGGPELSRQYSWPAG
jgi:hypothetical protein